MSAHSVTDARNRLPELIDRALQGEDVVITRNGRAIVELKPVPETPRPVSSADLDWLIARRVGRAFASTDAGALVSAMRDGDVG